MTSRLKRKLGDMGIDPSSSKANESFCLIGTPLPPLEKSRDTGEFVPLWKQDVRDEKGRRRLHGAFTGGFSAGYFNTVGSKEGWTPQTFVSSRADRAKARQARPEDFMDEEDLSELREGQTLVDTHERTVLDGGITGPGADDSLVSALATALLPPTADSAGMRILKKMGWRPGSGIGPRVSYAQRKRQEARAFVPPAQLRAVGAVTSAVDDGRRDEGDDEEAKKHTYPPLNTVVPVFRRKDNAHGLGYEPGIGLTEMLASEAGSVAPKGTKGPNISAGFGLGALNEAEEDDLDVYDNGLPGGSSASTARRLAYDAEDDDGAERIVLGSASAARRGKGAQGPGAGAGSNASAPVSRGALQTFRDGRPVLPGFVASEKPIIEDKWFPLPDIPKDWAPDPRRVWEKDKENFVEGVPDAKLVQAQEPKKDGKGWRSSQLTADERGSMLGETPLPSAPRSVFDYLAPKDRERLQKMAIGSVAPTPAPTAPSRVPTHDAEPGPEPAPDTDTTIQRVDPAIARLALQGFQPFTADPVKHARYTAYLTAQAASADAIPFGPFVGQDATAFSRELGEYVQAARVFRPVSAAMAGRFTSAAVVEQVGNGQGGLSRPLAKPPGAEEEMAGDASEYLSHPKEEEKAESAKDHAARTGMFGPLTREVTPWQPKKLLCKRFGVKDPNPEIHLDEDAPASTSASASTSAAAGRDWNGADVLALANTGTVSSETRLDGSGSGVEGGGGRPGKRDIANIGLGEDESQGRDTLTYKRPPREIFKAIFASDEESEEEEEEADKQGKMNGVVGPLRTPPASEETMPVNSADDAPAVVPPAGNDGASTSRSTSYLPSATNGTLNDATGTIDLAAFKPTFVPRSGHNERERDRVENRKEKKDKKDKKKAKTLVSFEVDEDGEDNKSWGVEKRKEKERDRSGDHKKGRDKDRDKGRKKKRKERHEHPPVDEDDESMWVEKPPPEVIHTLPTVQSPPAEVPADEPERGAMGPPRGRKRAVDFM